MADSQAGAKTIQDEPEHIVVPEGKGAPTEQNGVMSEGLRAKCKNLRGQSWSNQTNTTNKLVLDYNPKCKN